LALTDAQIKALKPKKKTNASDEIRLVFQVTLIKDTKGNKSPLKTAASASEKLPRDGNSHTRIEC